jgi:hypothetical protein
LAQTLACDEDADHPNEDEYGDPIGRPPPLDASSGLPWFEPVEGATVGGRAAPIHGGGFCGALIGTAGNSIVMVAGAVTLTVVLPSSAVYSVNSVPVNDPAAMVRVPDVSDAGTTNE